MAGFVISQQDVVKNIATLRRYQDGRKNDRECHHIIALANEGADRTTNVIALCPNDHRDAHFGKRRHEIEEEMIREVRKINRKPASA